MRLGPNEPLIWIAAPDKDYMLKMRAVDAAGNEVGMGAAGHSFAEQSGGNSPLPPLMGVLGTENLFGLMGRFILLWGAFEKVHIELIERLLKTEGTHEPGWTKKPFSRRNDILKRHWKAKFSNHKPLIECVEGAMARAHNAKQLRDAISHKGVHMQWDPTDKRGASVRFTDEITDKKAASKPYYLDDIRECMLEITRSSGELQWLFDSRYELPFPPCCKSALQQLRGKAPA